MTIKEIEKKEALVNGFIYDNKILEIGIFNVIDNLVNPVSTFKINENDTLISGESIKVMSINENSINACITFKNFFKDFHDKEFSFKEAIDFLEENKYTNFKRTSL